MKILNEKGKLFGIINVLDFAVIIFVILLVLGAYYKFGVLGKAGQSASMEPISYTVEIKEVRAYTKDNIIEGDKFFDKTSGNCIGTVSDIQYSNSYKSCPLLDGSLVSGEVENRFDVVVTIEAEGTTDIEGRSYVNRTYELIKGSTKKFTTKYVEFEGSVKDIL
ncbi:MAG: DUF4330 domain-containing protein [Lachnospiraceae bacterium]|nr:DUF4330 domain-containing protein [Lachnospiraceae bacterium]